MKIEIKITEDCRGRVDTATTRIDLARYLNDKVDWNKEVIELINKLK